MSTRSAIIRKTADGYLGVYCHFDGYFEGVGKTLLEHYKSDSKVVSLVSGGQISVLGSKIIPNPNFEHDIDGSLQEDVTAYYHRDRGEDLVICEGKTVQEVEQQIGHNGFVYVWDGQKWMCNSQDLSEILAVLAE